MTVTTRGSGEGKPIKRRTRSTDQDAEDKAKTTPPGSPKLRSSSSPKVTHKSPHSKRTYFHVHPTHTTVRSSPLSKDVRFD
jgi:hypothetical protein